MTLDATVYATGEKPRKGDKVYDDRWDDNGTVVKTVGKFQVSVKWDRGGRGTVDVCELQRWS